MKHTLACKYCGAAFYVRCKPDEVRFYLRCCAPCWENDEPGMARFDKMAERMGTTWALNHYAPVEAGRCC